MTRGPQKESGAAKIRKALEDHPGFETEQIVNYLARHGTTVTTKAVGQVRYRMGKEAPKARRAATQESPSQQPITAEELVTLSRFLQKFGGLDRLEATVKLLRQLNSSG